MGDIRKLSGRSRGVAQEVAAWRDRHAAARRSSPSHTSCPTWRSSPLRNGRRRTVRSSSRHAGCDGRHLAQGGADRDPRSHRHGVGAHA